MGTGAAVPPGMMYGTLPAGVGRAATTMYSVQRVVVQEEHVYILMKCGDVVEIPLSELRKLLAPALLEAFT